MSIPEQMRNDTALIVPVWDFFGSYTLLHPGESEPDIWDSKHDSLITINAVDGTLIHRGSGY